MPPSPILDYLESLRARHAQLAEGAVADYIPELAHVDPDRFGICIATRDGFVYEVGDSRQPFTLQSISKPLTYGLALEDNGEDTVLAKIGVEPTGDAFNAISLRPQTGAPLNPLINAGAIAACGLVPGDTVELKTARILDAFSRYAGRALDIDESVYSSESATGHRNRAIAYMMLNSGMIHSAPETILDIYFSQCSVRVTCADLAVMAATLANDGVNPLTGEVALQRDYIQDVLTVMNSCGMYNYAGQWSYEVGMPAKSGVSGCIIAVIPGQIGLAVFSPPIDAIGNSVRGIRVCQEISNEFELHAFNNRTNVKSVIRRLYRGDVVRSNRLRTPEERKVLTREGQKIAVLEVQGALFFGSTEQLLRKLTQLASEARYVIVDFKRVHFADASGRKLITRAARSMAEGETELVFASIADAGPLAPLAREFAEHGDERLVRVFSNADAALEWCEDQLLAHSTYDGAGPKFALTQLDLFKGLKPEEYRLVESIVRPLIFEKGEVIIREGADAKLFFVVARGTVSVQIRVQGDRKKRVASIGPGLSFGEMALLDGGKRSADIIADERVICYGLAVEQLQELAAEHPNIMITILGNLTREFSERLRHANDEISALE